MTKVRKPSSNRRPITATEVARAAGVSQSAVSRAFSPGTSIAPETRKRILEAAKRLGYRPNAIARSLTKGRSRLIGVVLAYMENQFYPEVLQALCRRLQSLDYRVILFTTEADGSSDLASEAIMDYRIDGLVLASTTLSSALAEECRAAGIPVVLLNRKTENDSVSSVTGDNIRGAEVIAEFLAAGGHQRFFYMAGLENSSTSRDREHGYTSWLAQNGFGPPLRAVGHYSFSQASSAARVMLSRRDRPDAVFCANDHMALAMVEVARHEFGLAVGQDISIVGFDDVGAARWPSFSLTSFSQPVGPMADETVAILNELISDPSLSPRQTNIPGELVVRSSARRPPSGILHAFDRQIWRPSNAIDHHVGLLDRLTAS